MKIRTLHQLIADLHVATRPALRRELLDRVIDALGYEPSRDERLLELGRVQLEIMSSTRRFAALRMGKKAESERIHDRLSQLLARREVLLQELAVDTHVPELDE